MPASTEGARILTICNACRYCEGFCAVFPAMEQRRSFSLADVNYLANLCHNCRECLDACQYAHPHEFAVDVPRTLSEIRSESYRRYAWPGWLGGWLTLGALAMGLSAGLLRVRYGASNFYAAISHRSMVVVFGAIGLYALMALILGLRRCWREWNPQRVVTSAALSKAFNDALSLKYLSARPRSWFHHLTSYGFLLCFASTTTAAIYHYVLGLRAPYGYFSLPVILGTLGGIGLVIGPAGLLATNRPSDRAFVSLLLSTSASGLLLLAFRETSAMPILLVVHLAIVLALFVSMPYGKFVHWIYRVAALVRCELERQRG